MRKLYGRSGEEAQQREHRSLLVMGFSGTLARAPRCLFEPSHLHASCLPRSRIFALFRNLLTFLPDSSSAGHPPSPVPSMRTLDLCTFHSVELSIVLAVPRDYLAFLLQPAKSARDKCLIVRSAAVPGDVIVQSSICVDDTPGSVTLPSGYPDDVATPKEVRGLHPLVPRLIFH